MSPLCMWLCSLEQLPCRGIGGYAQLLVSSWSFQITERKVLSPYASSSGLLCPFLSHLCQHRLLLFLILVNLKGRRWLLYFSLFLWLLMKLCLWPWISVFSALYCCIIVRNDVVFVWAFQLLICILHIFWSFSTCILYYNFFFFKPVTFDLQV